jgi:hypothetical protein
MVHRLFTANHAYKRMGSAFVKGTVLLQHPPGMLITFHSVSDSVTSKSYMHGMQFAVFFFACQANRALATDNAAAAHDACPGVKNVRRYQYCEEEMGQHKHEPRGAVVACKV